MEELLHLASSGGTSLDHGISNRNLYWKGFGWFQGYDGLKSLGCFLFSILLQEGGSLLQDKEKYVRVSFCLHPCHQNFPHPPFFFGHKPVSPSILKSLGPVN